MDESVLIVTPSLNQGRFIRQTIESVLTQDVPGLIYRVIDGGSTDTTVGILSEYQDDSRFEWISEPDNGQAHAICKGFNRGDGDILAWLNADDVYFPGAIKEAVRLLQQNPDALMVSGSVQMIDEGGGVQGAVLAGDLSLEDMLALREYIPQPGAFIRRAAFDVSGGLDEALDFAFDLDLFLRLRQQGEMCSSASIFAAHRLHAQSKTISQHPLMRREAAQVARRFLTTGKFDKKKRRRLRSRADLVEAYAAYQLHERWVFVMKLLRGLLGYPGHLPLLLKGTNRPHFKR